MNVLFLCSGDGGNMKFLDKISKKVGAPSKLKSIVIVGVIADRECGALEYARSNNIFSCTHSFKRTFEEDSKLILLLKKFKADVIVTNIHKIISSRVVNEFEGKLINVHYSILPSFAGSIGMNTVKNAIASGCKFLGSTSHVVTSKLDGGYILCQSIFSYSKQTDVYNLVFRTGALCLLSGILQLGDIEGSVQVFGEIQTNPIIDINSVVLIDVFNELK
jgi:phosphoribosylglycinamide formyltransferase-1